MSNRFLIIKFIEKFLNIIIKYGKVKIWVFKVKFNDFFNFLGILYIRLLNFLLRIIIFKVVKYDKLNDILNILYGLYIIKIIVDK